MRFSPDLEKLGFDASVLEGIDAEQQAGRDIARVVAVHKEKYMIDNGLGDVMAEVVGKILYSAESPVDYPAVGDWVLASYHDEGTFAVIHGVLPRKSLLKRKTPGKKIDFQLVAANVDVALIVQSLDDDFNLRRLERYLVMVNESGIEAVVLLSKDDLLDHQRIEERVGAIHDILPDLHVQPFNNLDDIGMKDIKALLESGMTYCLLGSSGVGKTSLMNNLIGAAQFKTKTVRAKDGKGRHATTARQLIRLESGAMLVDTPGMRELGNFAVETGLDETFADIISLRCDC